MTPAKTYYRSVFISDMHLGSRGAQAKAVSDFLDLIDCDNLYCVGDCIDFWALKKRFYFPDEHSQVVRRVLKKAHKDTTVIYIPGNHDEIIRDFVGEMIGNISIHRDFIHTSADGRQFLVTHGDDFDCVVKHARWVALLGDLGYSALLRSNRWINKIRRRFGFQYWSLSAYVKSRVKSAVNFIGEYEEAVAHAVRDRDLDGVICGHIHHPEIRDMGGVVYMNSGDWVETCSALVEHADGRFELIYWKIEETPKFVKAA